MNRVGIGYDVHRFAEGETLVLGGVEIAHDKGLLGHSDADVICHAIADALLGAVGEADIGHFFPPGDPKFAGINSLEILKDVREVVEKAGGTIVNVDAMVLAEEPKITPYVDAMKQKLGEALGVQAGQVAIKATTNERMGFIGRSEGIAAMAVCSVEVGG